MVAGDAMTAYIIGTFIWFVVSVFGVFGSDDPRVSKWCARSALASLFWPIGLFFGIVMGLVGLSMIAMGDDDDDDI